MTKLESYVDGMIEARVSSLKLVQSRLAEELRSGFKVDAYDLRLLHESMADLTYFRAFKKALEEGRARGVAEVMVCEHFSRELIRMIAATDVVKQDPVEEMENRINRSMFILRLKSWDSDILSRVLQELG